MRVLRTPQTIFIFMFFLGLFASKISNVLGAFIMFCALLYFFYAISRACAENIAFISLWLFFGPLFISSFIGVFFIEYLPDFIFWIGDGKFIFFSIPLISSIFVITFRDMDRFSERLKVSLKINNIVIVCITFGFVWYAYSVEDFSKLIPSIEELQHYHIGPREFIVLMLQIITFPYIISNLISDALLEISSYLQRYKIHRINRNL